MIAAGNGHLDPRREGRILVVDDDEDILKVVRYTLEAGGFQVTVANSASKALECLEREGLPHLVILDIMMPEVDGIELGCRIRRSSDVPMIMLTAVNEEQVMVQAIRELAEDYVTKPFRPQELLARVERVLRRISDFSYAGGRQVVIDQRLAIDFAHTSAVIDGQEVPLTPTETKILHILTRSSGRTITTDFLLSRIWPTEEVYEDTVRVHVHRLRQKIEPNPKRPEYLLTRRGLGYAFSNPSAA